MRRAAFIVLLLWPSLARSQFAPQEWSADQDGMNNACYDVAYFQANNLAGGGVVCVEADNTGKLFPVACTAIGGVSSVTGTAAHILATPTTGAVIVDLIATAVTPGAYTYATFTVDADGRLTAASSGTAPVISVTGTAQRISVTAGTAPVVDTIGGFYSGAVAAGNENLGASLTTGLIKGNVSGGVCSMSTAVAGTDYQAPLSAGTGITFVGSTAVTSNLSTGVGGGQSCIGGTGATDDLTLTSTANASKSIVWIGTGRANNSSHFDEANTQLMVGTTGAATSDIKIISYAAKAGGVINLASNDAGVSTTAFAASGSSLGNGALGTSYFLTKINGLAFTGTSGFDTAQAGILSLVTTNNAPLNISNLGDGATGGDVVITSKLVTNELWRFKVAGQSETVPIAAPSTPAAGKAYVYVDSTSKNLVELNDAGTKNHGIQTVTCGANTFGSATTDAGGLTCTQPTFANLSGTLTCGQSEGPWTGDVSKAANSCTTALLNIPNDVTQAGDILATEIAAPSAPAAGAVRVYASAAGNIAAIDPSGNINHGIRTQSCSASQFFNGVQNGGIAACAQPAFSDLSGAAACGQLPALTGAVTSSGCATTITSTVAAGSCTDCTLTYNAAGQITSATAGNGGKVALSFDFFGLPAGTGWLVTGSDTAVKTFGGFAVEYPLGQIFTSVRLRCINGLNSGTGFTSMTLTVTRNASATLAAVTIPASSGTVAWDSGGVAIAAGASGDTYGLEFNYTGATAPAGVTDFTCTMVLQ